MFPSSAIRIAGQSPDRLEMLDPPMYSAAAVVFVVGTIFLWLNIGRRHAPGVLLSWPELAISLGIVFVGLKLVTSRARIVLSRAAGTLTIERQYLGIRLFPVKVPLSDIRSASVEAMSGPRHKIILVLRTGGEPVPLGSFTGQDGHYAAANAINDFLSQK